MAVRGVRGATTVRANDAKAIFDATAELLRILTRAQRTPARRHRLRVVHGDAGSRRVVPGGRRARGPRLDRGAAHLRARDPGPRRARDVRSRADRVEHAEAAEGDPARIPARREVAAAGVGGRAAERSARRSVASARRHEARRVAARDRRGRRADHRSSASRRSRCPAPSAWRSARSARRRAPRPTRWSPCPASRRSYRSAGRSSSRRARSSREDTVVRVGPVRDRRGRAARDHGRAVLGRVARANARRPRAPCAPPARRSCAAARSSRGPRRTTSAASASRASTSSRRRAPRRGSRS